MKRLLCILLSFAVLIPQIYADTVFADGDTAESFKALNFTEYQDGIMNRLETAFVENTVFDGKDAVKITVNREFENKDAEIVVDGWGYAPARIDLKDYKFLAITYYIDGELPENSDAQFRIGISKVGSALTGYFTSYANQPLKTGSWQIAVFNMNASHILNPDLETHYISQIHISPFYGTSIGEFTSDISIYINSLVFSKQKPSLEIREGYFEGYGDGFFKPGNKLTRAEACAIISRLAAGGESTVPPGLSSEFTDVPSDRWDYKYIAYLEDLGFFSAYSDNIFLPDKPITRTEFTEMLFKAAHLTSKDLFSNSSFSDGINNYSDKDITRAEAVKLVNDVFYRGNPSVVTDDVRYLYNDVPPDYWAYPEICEVSLPHLENNGEWVCSMLSPKNVLGGNDRVDLEAGASFLAELDITTEKRIEEIRNTYSNITVSGKSYYVSSTLGNDSNDGLSPNSPWKTLEKVSNPTNIIQSGDAVFFRRGDVWRERLTAYEGVTYSAYDYGEKPRFYGSYENGGNPDKWSLLEGTENIWVYSDELIDIGVVVLNADRENAVWTYKEVPDLVNGKFYVRGTDILFDVRTHLDDNLDFFCDIPTTKYRETKGKLYFRCDEGNPGEIYDSIELNPTNHILTVKGDNVLIDNICIKYGGAHGISSGSRKNLTVQNCEFGWIGGGIHYYSGNGTVVRYGNGVEIYGEAENYTVDNCYIYQCYDAGVTHQYNGTVTVTTMKDIVYSNNVIEDCIYSVEYFNSKASEGAVCNGENVLITNNIMRRAGYGFGITRPNGNSAAHIKGNGQNEYTPGTFIIENNIFDRSSNNMINSTAYDTSWLPVYRSNTYIQVLDGILGFYTGERLFYNSVADLTVKHELGDDKAAVYFAGSEYAMKNY